jgi:hypothetical protein
MTPETPKPPRKPRTTKTEAAKAKKAVDKVIGQAQTELKKHAIGRPSSYDPVVAEQICELLSEGVPLREICRMEGMPPWRNIYFWMARDPDLSAHIARAREVGYDNIAEECLHIADTPQLGEEVSENTDEKGIKTVTVKKVDMLGHRKLQIETRLKLLAKWSNKYSDKTVITGDPNGAPIKTEEAGSGRLYELIRNMEMAKRAAD